MDAMPEDTKILHLGQSGNADIWLRLPINTITVTKTR